MSRRSNRVWGDDMTCWQRPHDKDWAVGPVYDSGRGRAESTRHQPIFMSTDDDDIGIISVRDVTNPLWRVSDIDQDPVSKADRNLFLEVTDESLRRCGELVHSKRNGRNEHAGRWHLRRDDNDMHESDLGADGSCELDGMLHDERSGRGDVDGCHDLLHGPV